MMVTKTFPARCIARRAALLACAGLLSITAPLFAQSASDPGAPEVFVPLQLPSGWQPRRVNGIDLALPPDLRTLQDHRDEKFWGQADEATRTGFAIGLKFTDTPERDLKRDGAIAAGALVLPNGQIFRRYVAQAPDDARDPARMETLVSELPMRGEDRLMVTLLVMNKDIAPFRPLHAQFLSGLALPPPGGQLQRDFLGGVLRMPVGPGWSGANTAQEDEVYLFGDGLDGRIRLNRGDVRTGGMQNGTPGTPVLFLGQKAQFFAHEDGSETVDNDSGDVGQARLIVLETCLPDGAVITLRFSGMPALFHDPGVAEMVAGAEIVMPEGAAPCPAERLPSGSRLDPAAARTEIAPPFDASAPGAVQARADGTALAGLYSYRLPIGWTATPDARDQRIRFASDDGQVAIVLARGAALFDADGPAALVPQGTFHKIGIILGWPAEKWEWDGPGAPSGLHRLYVHAHCLPGGERFGMLISGSKAFQDGGELSKLLRDVSLHMPEAITPCDDPAEGIGQTPAVAANPAPPVEPSNSRQAAPLPDPTAAAQNSQKAAAPDIPAQPDDDAWFGQPPASTLPSPATRSLAEGGATPGSATVHAPMQTTTPLAAPPPPPAANPVGSMQDPDRFEDIAGGYARYHNSRYGTFIAYPSGYFLPAPPPGNGDGRRFTSADGTAQFYVFAQYNAEGLSQDQQIARDKADSAHIGTSYERAGLGWYVLSGVVGPDIFYRRVIEDATGLIHVFEITYPTARKAEFDAVVAYMAQSFGSPAGN